MEERTAVISRGGEWQVGRKLSRKSLHFFPLVQRYLFKNRRRRPEFVNGLIFFKKFFCSTFPPEQPYQQPRRCFNRRARILTRYYIFIGANIATEISTPL